jgi:hypothetical protein
MTFEGYIIRDSVALATGISFALPVMARGAWCLTLLIFLPNEGWSVHDGALRSRTRYSSRALQS